MKGYIVKKLTLIVTLCAIVIFSSIFTPFSAYADPPTVAPGTCGTENFTECQSTNGIYFYNPQATTCASTGGSVTSLSGTDNEQKIWNYLTAAGLSANQTAGILGNIATESAHTFSPTVNEFSKTFGQGGYGIIQWTGNRRNTLLAALNTQQPTLMAKYYNVDYSTEGQSYTTASQGYVSKSASTGTLMPVADNDALLLVELNFLVQESSTRHISSVTASKGLGTLGAVEWDTIKSQTTITDASNVWVYNNEVPSDPDTTAIARAANAQVIYTQYSTATTGSTCAIASASQSKQALAKQINASGNISYWPSGGKTATQQIIDGVAAGTNNGNSWPCGLNLKFLQILAAITSKDKVVINGSNEACLNQPASGLSSRHYNGNGSAMDFGSIDGKQADTTAGANLLLQFATPYLVNNSSIGQVECNGLSNASLTIPKLTINRFNDACTHLHIDVPPDADPSLQCKLPVNFGGCDTSQVVK